MLTRARILQHFARLHFNPSHFPLIMRQRDHAPPIPKDIAQRTAQANRNNAVAFRALAACLKSSRTLAFVGAGLSKNVKLPLWGELLSDLAKKAVKAGRIHAREASLVQELNEPLWVAGYLRSRLSPRSYANFIRRTFTISTIPPDAEKLLRRFVALPFAHFLTTNYDNVLEKACAQFRREKLASVDWHETPGLNDFIHTLGASLDRRSVRHCVHLHGLATKPENIVLSEGEYLNRYVRSAETYRKLLAIFSARPLVFVGFGMKDADLMRILRDVHATLTTTAPKHFIVLALKKSEPTPEVTRRHFAEVYGVQPVFYPAEGGVTAGLSEFLAALKHGDSRKLKKIPRAFVQSAVDTRPRRKPYESWEKLVAQPPRAGRPGRLSLPNRAVLYVDVDPVTSDYYWVRTVLVIAAPKPSKGDKVIVSLHPTFEPDEDTAKLKADGTCSYNFLTYGAFKIGFRFCDPVTGRNVALKFDLSKPAVFPRGFRES